jgi:hypothetical protein
MAADVDALKLKRDQLNARIQKAEARLKNEQKKADDRVKVLVGAALLDQLKQTGSIPSGGLNAVLALMNAFLSRPAERVAVLGEDNRGSAALHRLIGVEGPIGQKGE